MLDLAPTGDGNAALASSTGRTVTLHDFRALTSTTSPLPLTPFYFGLHRALSSTVVTPGRERLL
jgi:hypothetical protein